MLPRLWQISISALALESAWAQESEPFVAEFRLQERGVEAIAWRAGDDILVEGATLEALGLPAPQSERVALSSIGGLTWRERAEDAAIELTCTARCYPLRDLRGRNEVIEITPAAPGAFLNYDLAATHTEDETELAGAFELGLFGPAGFGEHTWIARDDDWVRLETRWTLDRPHARLRARIGDSITRAGASGVPVRFGGVQIARDFSLDPGFVTYPTPTLQGEAAAPSTVDLYIDGALRLRERVAAGPFAITEAPIIAGAGTAQIVVTDALGREEIVTQGFYASPAMLRAGLFDFSFAVGAQRENFALASNDYGDHFVMGLVRYGVSNALTGEARIETSQEITGAGLGLSVSNTTLGQIDLALAGSQDQDRSGALARIGWFRNANALSFGAEIESASENFIRIGEARDAPPPALRAAATMGATLPRGDAITLVATQQESRESAGIQTLALSYAPPPSRWGVWGLSALYTDDGEEALTLGLTFSASLSNRVNVGAGIDYGEEGSSLSAAARRTPPSEGGWGWRARADLGALDRYGADVRYEGARGVAQLDASHASDETGLRAQYAGGFVFIDGYATFARPVRESFALVYAGAPNVMVLRDRRPFGETDAQGRVIVPGLRPYQNNRLALDLNDLPIAAEAGADEMLIAPAARSGVVVRFPVTLGAAGEIRVRDERGVDLPAGAVLVRDDGARFPIGAEGRLYISGVEESVRLVRDGADACVIELTRDALTQNAALTCRAPT
ncbi:MAG: fimbria/pilus outer membrane usher protein [Hyphomonadaceae bacterium]